MIRFLAVFYLLACIAIAGEPKPPAKAIAEPSLENFFKLEDGIYSGGSPINHRAFDALAKLGVKMIISVDGSQPLVDDAKKRGIRYVHLPIGYDGVPENRIAELIQAAKSAKGTVYIHCHHGKHRGPAAAAVICEAIKGWSATRAEAWLNQAGTGKEYAGLFRDVKGFRMPDAAALARVPENLPEKSPCPPVVDAMVAIDGLFDRLKAVDAKKWAAPGDAPILMLEHFRELARMPATAARGDDFLRQLQHAEDHVAELQALCQKADSPIADKRAAFGRIADDCASCHRAHRNSHAN